MRKYQIEVKFPWDDKWFGLEYMPLYIFKGRAIVDAQDEVKTFGSGTAVRVRDIKNEITVWSDR